MSNKSLLLITYLFPPINSIGARRPYMVAKQFLKKGFTVSVFTSKRELKSIWNIPENFNVTYCNDLGSHLKPNKFIKILSKLESRFPKSHLLKRILNLIMFFIYPLDFKYGINIEENLNGQHYDFIFISMPPWNFLNDSKLLRKKFPNSILIADMRDPLIIKDHSVQINRVSSQGILKLIKNFKLKKTQNNALVNYDFILHPSKEIKANFLKNYVPTNFQKIIVVKNGFDEVKSLNRIISSCFRIIYTGIIYDEQLEYFELFLRAINKILKDFEIEVLFLGSELQKVKYNSPKDLDLSRVKIINQQRKCDTLENIQRCDLCLNFSYSGKNGIYGSKIFDYMQYKKPILHISDQNDSLTSLIERTKIGWVVKNEIEIQERIINLINRKSNGEILNYEMNENEINKFKFENQMNQLFNEF